MADKMHGAGIVINGEPVRAIKSGDECWLTVTAQFVDQGDHELNCGWFRSLFLTCISKANQSAACVNVFRSRAIFPDDIKTIAAEDPVVGLTFRVNLAKELGRTLMADSYYVSIAARQFLSNTVLVDVK